MRDGASDVVVVVVESLAGSTACREENMPRWKKKRVSQVRRCSENE